MDKNKIDKLVNETIDSMDGAAQAMPAPFLMTRIRARMNNEDEKQNYWERAISFLTRPAFAFPALALVLLLNFWMMNFSAGSNVRSSMDNQLVVNDGYSISSATSLFDIENNVP
ncbi:MAG: hypothetical protein QM687_02800 [Ferruginibacter sp.]